MSTLAGASKEGERGAAEQREARDCRMPERDRSSGEQEQQPLARNLRSTISYVAVGITNMQEELARVKKREERERQQRIMVENERELERRKLEKQREAELDKQLMEEYA
eukprot:13326-Eustigmatos_ZCMA.PRE.1